MRKKDEAVKARLEEMSPDDLRYSVLKIFSSASASQRSFFLTSLQRLLRKKGLSLEKYVVPLGIVSRSIEDMTPNEIAHLVRYLKLNAPQTIPLVVEALTGDV